MLSPVATYDGQHHNDSDGPMSLVMTRSSRRGPWLPDEDQALLQLVRTQGANNWVRISQQLQHRSPKQCRERYHQNLKPSLKHDPISAQEGEVIERLVQEMGKRWAEIARRLGNRSDNAVKNWWNGSVNRRRRNPTHSSTGFKQVGTRLQPVPFTVPHKPKYSQHLPPLTKSDSAATDSTSHEFRRDMSNPQTPCLLQVQSPSLTDTHTVSAPAAGDTTHSTASQLRSSEASRAQMTSNSWSMLPQVRTSNLRPELPPLRSSSLHLSSGERRASTVEYPPISPALSDSSQRQVPSLVSDTQSMYSISPRTVTTPKPGIPAPADVGHPSWPDYNGTGQYSDRNPSYQHHYQPETYSRFTRYGPQKPGLQLPPIQSPVDDKFRDSRMNVSTLLH